MSKRTQYQQQLALILSDADALAAHLLRQSGLPGPRANLELASALADLCQQSSSAESLKRVLYSWLELDAGLAPCQSPREYLPFCALQALAAQCATVSIEECSLLVEQMRRAAKDPRWRMREAAVFALQRFAEDDFSKFHHVFVLWQPEQNLYEYRALLAAMAHAPFLRDAEQCQLALDLADRCLNLLLTSSKEGSESEARRVLQKGLEYAPSVFVAALPTEGFALLARWAGDERTLVKRIVAANLRKARLQKKFSEQVEIVGELLMAGDGI